MTHANLLQMKKSVNVKEQDASDAIYTMKIAKIVKKRGSFRMLDPRNLWKFNGDVRIAKRN